MTGSARVEAEQVLRSLGDLAPRVLGRSLDEAVLEVTERDLQTLRQSLLPHLAPPRFAREDERDALRQALQARLGALREGRNGDPHDPEFLAWSQAARDVMKIVRREVEL